MDTYTSLYTTGGVPALVSTMITIIYFAVKFLSFVLNARTRVTEGRKRTLRDHPPAHHQSSASGTESNYEVYKDLSDCSGEEINNGRGQWPRPTGTLFLQSGRQDVCFSPDRTITGDQKMPPLQTDAERRRSQRGSDTREYLGAGSESTHIDSTVILMECRRGEDASHEQSQSLERDG